MAVIIGLIGRWVFPFQALNSLEWDEGVPTIGPCPQIFKIPPHLPVMFESLKQSAAFPGAS